MTIYHTKLNCIFIPSPTNYSKRRSNGEMICKGCGQFSSAQFCYMCLSIKLDEPINCNFTFGSGLMADNVCDNISNGSGMWPPWTISDLSLKYVDWSNWTISEDDKEKKCSCLTSDLMINGCTCGGK